MTIRDRNILKSYFETGDYPTEEQFSDLIDSYIHKNDTITGIGSVDKKTVFVDVIEGNDTDGEIENSSKPFATIDAAVTALPAWDNESHWTIFLLSAGSYPINVSIPRRNITFSSTQKVSIQVNVEGNITDVGNNTIALATVIFDIPEGTYSHTFSNIDTGFYTQRATLDLYCKKIVLNYTGSTAYTALAYFNLGSGNNSYGSIIKIDTVETNVPFYYIRKFSNDDEDVFLDVEIGKVIAKEGTEFSFFTEDVRFDLAEATIKIHSFINEATHYVNIFKASSVGKKKIYIGDVTGQGNTVFLFSAISNGIIQFLNSELSDVYFVRTWSAWSPGYKKFLGTIVKYTDTNAAIVNTTSSAGAVIHFKNLFIKEFISNDVNAWIFDLWQNNDTKGEWIFENCHVISNCRTMRNGGSTDRIKLIGVNVFDDAGDTTNYSIDKRLPDSGQFFLRNEGILKTKTVRDTLNTDSNPAVVITNTLNTF